MAHFFAKDKRQAATNDAHDEAIIDCETEDTTRFGNHETNEKEEKVMFQLVAKRRSMAGVTLSLLICCAVIIGSVMVAPPVAKASDQSDKLAREFNQKYGGSDIWVVTKEDSPETIKKLKKEGKPYRVLPLKSHLDQTKALSNAIHKILNSCDLTPSMLNGYRPSFSFWCSKNDQPYWQIKFNVSSKDNILPVITVRVSATDGSIMYFNSTDSDG